MARPNLPDMPKPRQTDTLDTKEQLARADTRIKLAEAEASDRARHATFIAAVAEALSRGGTPREMLTRCAAAAVQHLDAALCRIWTVNTAEPVLELQASEGLKTRLDGPYARVSIAQFKAGRITENLSPLVSNQVIGHPGMPDQAWLKRERLTSFAGYPLVLEGRLLGVIAMFSRAPISDGVIEALASVAQAIALGVEHQRSEESRKRLAEILDVATDFITIGLPDGPPFYLNRAAREAFGLGPDESIESLFAVRAPEFPDYFRRVILPAVIHDGAWSGETTYVVNGRRIPVSQVTVGHKNAEGAIEFFSTISRDISTQKEAGAVLRQATDALIDAEERTRFALDAARTGVWEADLAIGRVTWSETMRQIHGVLPLAFDLTIEGFLALVHPDDRESMARIMRPQAECSDTFELEVRILWPDGSLHWMQSRGRVMCDDAGRAVRVLAVAQDVTERKELEGQLRQAQKIEAVGQLAGGLAHDFNNLLTVMLGFSRLVEEQLDAADPRHANIEEVIKAGQRASQLTQQLLAFSRKQVLQPVILDLNELLEENRRMLGRLAGEQIDLVLHPEPGLRPVKADRGQIEQILVNLVVNARDALERGGTLTLSTAQAEIDELHARNYLAVEPGRYVVLAVADTGIGMSEDTRQHIFEPFFTTKAHGKGTGMGLATVFGIVKQSGGFIKVVSAPGRGTTFRIFFPAAAVDAPQALSDAPAPAPSGGSETILLVEDEVSVRALVCTVLQRKGYTVVAAVDPQDAIRIAGVAGQRIDLLLTDVMMPGLTGDALFRQLRATTRSNLRVLYMSGYADEAIVSHGIFDPGTPFLQKPFTGSVLARKVRDVLDQSV